MWIVVRPTFPTKLHLKIQVVVKEKNIFQMVLDEGVPTYILSLSCWRAIGYPSLTTPQTMSLSC